jgi:hypothetical protein
MYKVVQNLIFIIRWQEMVLLLLRECWQVRFGQKQMCRLRAAILNLSTLMPGNSSIARSSIGTIIFILNIICGNISNLNVLINLNQIPFHPFDNCVKDYPRTGYPQKIISENFETLSMIRT